MSTIRVNLRHQFSEALEDDASDMKLNLQFEVPASGTVGVFGPSGSGKTTLLRAIAGLMQADEADIRFAGRIWQDASTFLPTHQRRIGYVFQEPSLFPHLTVLGNIEYGQNRASESRINVSNIAQLFEIDNLLNRSVDRLSGGEQQRVAIVRALLSNPQLLLLDEPLSALDLRRKEEILPFLARLKTEFSIPMLYVTHAADELALLADHLLVIENGEVREEGEITSTYPLLGRGPGTEVHMAVLLEGEVGETDSRWHLATYHFPGGKLQIRSTKHSSSQTGNSIRVRVQARDVSISLNEGANSSILNRLKAEVLEVTESVDAGMALVRSVVSSESGQSEFLAQITAKSASDLALEPGKPVYLQIKSVALLG